MTKTRRQFYAAVAAFALVFAALSPAASAQEPQQYGALERGYRTGYSDGYQSGWGDQLRRAPADFRAKGDYRRADRAYIAAYGRLEDYRDGYRQGFEAGYGAGHSRAGFDSSLPPGGLARRGTPDDDDTADSNTGTRPNAGPAGMPRDDDDDDEGSDSQPTGRRGGPVGGRVSGSETVLLVELLNRLSTDVSQRGDRFEARVVEPADLEGAVLTGTLAAVERPGKASGRALLQLQFDQIRLPGGGAAQEFNGQVIEVLPGGETGVADVDPEGGVRGKSTTKEDVTKVGAAAGIGAIIGGIAGGGKGAAIGAILGGGAGTAGVMTQRGKDIRLEPGQQLRVRSSRPVR